MNAVLAEPLYETGDLARYFGVSPSLVQRWAKQGLVTPRRTARGVALYSATDIKALERLRAGRAANRRGSTSCAVA